MNKVMLIGNLGRDPETRDAGNSVVCNFPVATTERFKNRDGDQEERTEWHRIVVWGKTAEACDKYLRKGSKVFVEGKIQSRKYDKDGEEKIAFEIIAVNVQFLDQMQKNDDREEAPARRREPEPERKPARQQPAATGRRQRPEDIEDDIPF